MSCFIISLLLFLSYTASAYKVSFFGESYINMPLQEAKLSTNIKLKFKTKYQNSLLLATFGRLDSCVLQLLSGKLRLSMKVSSHSIELYSPLNHIFNDDQWHDVSVFRYESNITLQIDSYFERQFLPPSVGSLNIHFGVYIGGLGDFSINSINSKFYFRGCMSDIYFNSINVLKRAKENALFVISKYISWTCEEEFDVNEEKSISFLKNDSYVFAEFSQIIDHYSLDIKTIEPDCTLIVGINAQYIILLEIIHGSLKLTFGTDSSKQIFFSDILISNGHWHSIKIDLNSTSIIISIDDQLTINEYKNEIQMKYSDWYIGGIPEENYKKIRSIQNIKYIHNGKEVYVDQIIFDLSFFVNDEKLNSILENIRFILHINITPVNDPPQIYYTKNKIFMLVENIAELLTTDYIRVEDTDSTPESLIYKVISPKIKTISGNFEINEHFVDSFSHKDVLDKRVHYIVSNDKRFEIFLEVSDGVKTSPIVALPVLLKPLQLKMVNNTGLVVSHVSATIISHSNLSFTTNSFNKSFDIFYNIIVQPQSGLIERKRIIDDMWIEVRSFTNRQLDAGQIRYKHVNGTPFQDEFKFIVKCFSFVSQIFDFRIKFTKFHLTVENEKELIIKGKKYTHISSNILKYRTVPQEIDSNTIIYMIMKSPTYGYIKTDKILKEKDQFTQDDLNNNRVTYALHQTTYSNFTDKLIYSINALKCREVNGTLLINYEVDESLKLENIFRTHEKIQVEEGGQATISRINFPIFLNKFHKLNFLVSTKPKHGIICKIYIYDNFEVLISSKTEKDFQYIASIEVDVKLINDNEPFRTTNKSLSVVKGQKKIITKDTLTYEDHDLNVFAKDIVYRILSISNGDIYLRDTLVTEFSQEEININVVSFKHNERKPDIGEILFAVSDGFHEINGFLITEASNEFIKLSENSKSIQQGTSVILNEDFLALSINFDIHPTLIKYKVISEPIFGKLYKNNINQSIDDNFIVTDFTQYDIHSKNLQYLNINQTFHDSVRLRVKCNELQAETTLNFHIYPPSYWNALIIKNNRDVYVEQGNSVNITNFELEVNSMFSFFITLLKYFNKTILI
uniref:CSON006659 protein n=1 Tax=Culicoides sonorensis TaxID=179676 RepID=A0A336JZW2_CULSO